MSLIAYLAVALATVALWEAARWMLARPVVAEPVATTGLSAELELHHESGLTALAAPELDPDWRAASVQGDLTPGCVVFLWARRSGDYPVKCLPLATRHWLSDLSDAEVETVRRTKPLCLDEHLAGRRMVRGLPAVQPLSPTPSIAQIAAQAAAAAVKARKKMDS